MSGARRTAIPAACLWMLVPAGCGETPAIAPPQILFGQDVCDVCGMIISDDRYAAGLVVDVEDDYATRSFDDLGCLLMFEDEHADVAVAARYVHDFRARTWRDAETAAFLHSGHLHTPMAFGVAALATEADARTLAGEFPGDVLDFGAVRDRFASGQLTIFPKQDPDA